MSHFLSHRFKKKKILKAVAKFNRTRSTTSYLQHNRDIKISLTKDVTLVHFQHVYHI